MPGTKAMKNGLDYINKYIRMNAGKRTETRWRIIT